MANIHVLEQTAPGRFRVVLHVAIPAGNNPAGVPWRTAVAASVNAAKPSVLPDGDGTNGTISAAEKAQIISGAVFEVVREEKGQTTASAANIYALRSAAILAELQARYNQYGRTI